MATLSSPAMAEMLRASIRAFIFTGLSIHAQDQSEIRQKFFQRVRSLFLLN
jgi:hypothetical protein